MAVFGVLFATCMVFASQDTAGHGEVHTKKGVLNPHAGITQKTDSTAHPVVTVPLNHGPVRVDNNHGTIFIPQIDSHYGRGSDGRGDPYPRCLLCHEGIIGVFESIVTSGEWEEVLYITGGQREAYALSNLQEFFSEISEAWWGVNDFYPFVRGEVITAFPEVAALMDSVWSVE